MLLFPEITKITPDDLLLYPTKAFEGPIYLIETIADADEACEYLRNYSHIGFDTETKPNFKKGRKNRVALLQLSTSEKAFLIRTNKIGIPRSVASILADPNILKIGAATKDDIGILKNLSHFEPKAIFDLQPLVRSFGVEQLGLKNIAALFLGFKISKGQQLTNWENEILTPQQQIYAATDAWVCLEIYKTIETAGYFQNPPKVTILPPTELNQTVVTE
jgi:ribonuclease D